MKQVAGLLSWVLAATVWANDGLPPGFSLSVVADEVPNARQMALSDAGVLFVGYCKRVRCTRFSAAT